MRNFRNFNGHSLKFNLLNVINYDGTVVRRHKIKENNTKQFWPTVYISEE